MPLSPARSGDERAVFRLGDRIGEIRVAEGSEYVELRVPGSEQFLKPGQAWGDVDALAVQREMIRRTIREHLDKEKRLRPQGIKVLSLFFIDEVARYRQYDAEGNPVKGDYARIFEEEYQRAARLPEYNTLFKEVDLTRAADEVHNGYFSIDKKGGWTDTEEENQANRDNAERAYNLIMKEKEKLLSFEAPLKFIFSHSALKEGWDNPNVFQICTLRQSALSSAGVNSFFKFGCSCEFSWASSRSAVAMTTECFAFSRRMRDIWAVSRFL